MFPKRERRRRGHLPAILGGLFLLAALALLPELGPPASPGPTTRLEHGRITAISQPNPETGGVSAQIMILEGDRAGQTVTGDLETPFAQAYSTPYVVGDEVIVQTSVTADGEFTAVSDRWRLPLLQSILAGFSLLVVLVGGWRGIRALIALALTIGVVVKVVLPLLLAGWAAVPLAVASASGITVVTLLLTEGFRRSTLAAAIGTFGALALTALLAALVTAAARFSLLQGSEEAGYLQSLVGASFDLGGLLLAAVIFGALGVLDDVTITQAATVAELAEANPMASRATLAGRAMNVGRSHIAATLNTLVLAYVAASLPLLLLFAVGRQSPATVGSTELVAIEIIRTLVGSIGIVAAVPLTTLVAAWLVPRTESHAKGTRPGS
ncbi:MAG TPA: YibE/F family protein [Nonomuraea sp.]|nr:YibE/F family protein [Nonomuraea sp.]